MDSYEATRTVFARLQSLDPENAHKIMGFLLLQENGEKDIIRLAFGPEAHLYALVTKARKELGLAAASAVSPSSFLLRQNSASRLLSPSWHAPAAAAAFSRSNSSSLDELLSPEELVGAKNVNAPPFYGGGDLADEFHLPDQLSFRDGVDCRGPTRSGDPAAFSYGTGWGVNGYHHRRSASAAADLRLGDAVGGLGWEPCLYFARGYCKNGDSCRFLHGLPEEAAATIAAKMDTAAAVEQQCQELLLRSNSQRIGGSSQLMASAIPFSPAGSDRPSPLSPSTKSLNFLLQQQQNESQSLSNYCRAAAAALMLGADEAHKFLSRSRSDLLANPSSRQIYLTFPADSTFSEEDVSNYFSIYGPVQDVRIPYQQKRMFGFVTFLYPETVKLILAKGNPHFVCDSRVLVKPYKEKGKVPDKFRKQQLCERGDFYGCTTPTSLDAREAYDLHQVGTRMLYNSSCQELLLRRKLEEQQQAAELQRAIELQGRRFMGLQLLDLKNRSLSSAAIASTNSPTFTPNTLVNPLDVSCNGGGGSSSSSSPDESPTDKSKINNSHISLKEDKDKPLADVNNNEDSDVQPSTKHNLPDSPFASPTKKSSSFALDLFSTSEEDLIASCTANNGGNSFNNTHLDMPSFDPCFKMPTFSSGFGAIGM
ncbi:zinc finger CCCH domain-containing protein 53-like isoform X1 [Zingiber officinale]|uniref:zinc finger CCCH domain-containing protein 53-like isoform X1 n=1 Tax=Zingiber officinale TaxID=94328 RepID=UPI001C4BB924|nr:zinc finger CCCH domain-containing protein 53-like isoform X1 [Zingiber officinale]